MPISLRAGIPSGVWAAPTMAMLWLMVLRTYRYWCSDHSSRKKGQTRDSKGSKKSKWGPPRTAPQPALPPPPLRLPCRSPSFQPPAQDWTWQRSFYGGTRPAARTQTIPSDPSPAARPPAAQNVAGGFLSLREHPLEVRSRQRVFSRQHQWLHARGAEPCVSLSLTARPFQLDRN